MSVATDTRGLTTVHVLGQAVSKCENVNCTCTSCYTLKWPERISTLAGVWSLLPTSQAVLSTKTVGAGTARLHVQCRPSQLLACNYLHADHAMRWLGHPIVAVAKSASKAYGPSPGAKQSCSNLTGRHRPSAICSNAVRAKLPVKNRSSGSRSLSTYINVPYPQCRCISTERTMCAGFAARGRSGQQGRELHWSAPVKLTAVQSSPWLRC